MPRPTHNITIQAPKNLCKWCDAHIAQNIYTKQYFLQRKGACNHCHDTGDHDFHSNGHLTLATYIVDRVTIV